MHALLSELFSDIQAILLGANSSQCSVVKKGSGTTEPQLDGGQIWHVLLGLTSRHTSAQLSR